MDAEGVSPADSVYMQDSASSGSPASKDGESPLGSFHYANHQRHQSHQAVSPTSPFVAASADSSRLANPNFSDPPQLPPSAPSAPPTIQQQGSPSAFSATGRVLPSISGYATQMETLSHSSPSNMSAASPGSQSISSGSPLAMGGPNSPLNVGTAPPPPQPPKQNSSNQPFSAKSPAAASSALPAPISSISSSTLQGLASASISNPRFHPAYAKPPSTTQIPVPLNLGVRQPQKQPDYQVESLGEGKDPRLLYDRKTGHMRYLGESCTLSLVEQIRRLFRQRIGESAFTEDPERYLLVDGPNFAVSVIPTQLPSKRLTTYLIQAFEKHVQPTGYVLQFPQFWRDIDQIYESPVSAATSQLCLLYLAIALGGVYFTTPPIEANIDADIGQELQRINLPSYFESALGYLRDTFEDGDLWVVQAYFLVSLYYEVMCKRNASWIQIGIAIRYAQALGMGRKWIDLSFSPAMQDHRKRLYRTLFLQDRLKSVYLGRPMSFGSEDLEQYVLTDPKTKDDEAQIQMVKLCQIIGEIWNNVYRSKYVSSSTSQALTTRLKAWSASFQKFARDTAVEQHQKQEERLRKSQNNNDSPAPSKPSDQRDGSADSNAGIIDVSHKIPWDQHQLLNLNMTYLHGIILLTRPFLFYTAARRPSNSSSLDADALRTFENLASKCVQSALTSVKLMENLFFNNRHPKRSTLVSYFIFTSSVMLLLRAFKCIPAEQLSLSMGISGSLRILSYYSNVDPSAKRFWNILKEMHMAVSQRQMSIINDSADNTPRSQTPSENVRNGGNGNSISAVNLSKDVPAFSSNMQNLQSKISGNSINSIKTQHANGHSMEQAQTPMESSQNVPATTTSGYVETPTPTTSNFITRTPSFVSRMLSSSSVPTPSPGSPSTTQPQGNILYSTTMQPPPLPFSTMTTPAATTPAATAPNTTGPYVSAATPTSMPQFVQLPSMVVSSDLPSVPGTLHGMSVGAADTGSLNQSPSLGHPLPLPMNSEGSPSSLFMNIEEIDFTSGDLEQWLFTSTGPVIDSFVSTGNGTAPMPATAGPVSPPHSQAPLHDPSAASSGTPGDANDTISPGRMETTTKQPNVPGFQNESSMNSGTDGSDAKSSVLPSHQPATNGGDRTNGVYHGTNDDSNGVDTKNAGDGAATTPPPVQDTPGALQPDYLSPEFDTIRGFLMHPGY